MKPYPGMPHGASGCMPDAAMVPQGGWREAQPGYGPGYPPTGGRAIEALNALPGAAGDLLFGGGGQGRDVNTVADYVGSYADWLRGMAR